MSAAATVLDHQCVACALGAHDRCPGCTCSEAGHHQAGRAPRPVRARRPRRPGGLSTDARRTQRQRDDLAAGIHPATRRPLLKVRAEPVFCGTCVHAERIHDTARAHWKCARHLLGMSRSAASDIRISWPACDEYESEEATAR